MKNNNQECCIPLTVKDCSVLLGAISAFGGVPFVKAQKPGISESELDKLSHLHENFLEIRSKCIQSGEVICLQRLDRSECVYLLRVLTFCQREYAGDLLDLRIHLNADGDSEIDNVRLKLIHALDLPISGFEPSSD